MPNKNGWDRSLGTSKEEQGIITPKQPHRRACGCWFRGDVLYQLCDEHRFAIEAAQKRAEVIQQQPPKPASAPWTENVQTSDAVSVGIVTPNEDEKTQATNQ